jgi:hypothetical protein
MLTNQIYRVTIRGRKLESRNLRELLARAVSEKRNMDRKLRSCMRERRSSLLPSTRLGQDFTEAMLAG